MHAAIVGQAPARASLEPLDGRSGRRLERLAGIRDGELGLWFALGNLLPAWPGNRERRPGPHSAPGDRFDAGAARESWRDLSSEVLHGHFDLVLLLGRSVAAAAGAGRLAYFERERREGYAVAVFPHPSGASHFWNAPRNRVLAAAFLRQVVRELAR